MTSLALGRVAVEYSVRRIEADSEDGALDDMAECRPCTNKELLERACMADFVVDGILADVTESSSSRWTKVLVDVNNIVHHSTFFTDFLQRRTDHHAVSLTSHSGLLVVPDDSSTSADATQHHLDDVLPGSIAATPLPVPVPAASNVGDVRTVPSAHQRRGRSKSGRSIVVSVPAVCAVHGGYGRFVFVGSVHLKRALRLTCAPRAEDFWRLWNEAVSEDRNPCTLSARPADGQL